MTFKHALVALLLIALCSACTFNTETSQQSSPAAEATIASMLKEDHEAIYEDASIKMKSHVSKEDFINVANLHKNVYGKIVDAKLNDESGGTFESSGTVIYHYEVKNEQGETFNLKNEYLNGHLLKSFFEEPDWREEPAFIRELVTPVRQMVFSREGQKIFELFDQKFPLDQIQALANTIADTFEGGTPRYKYNWTDDDEHGKLMVGFVYAYEGKGTVDYRFYVEKGQYPLAGIYYTPDPNTKIP